MRQGTHQVPDKCFNYVNFILYKIYVKSCSKGPLQSKQSVSTTEAAMNSEDHQDTERPEATHLTRQTLL